MTAHLPGTLTKRTFQVWPDHQEDIDPEKPDFTTEASSPVEAAIAYANAEGDMECSSSRDVIVRDVENDLWREMTLVQSWNLQLSTPTTRQAVSGEP